jgi:tetratricopeptide (TPR) repeat protein
MRLCEDGSLVFASISSRNTTRERSAKSRTLPIPFCISVLAGFLLFPSAGRTQISSLDPKKSLSTADSLIREDKLDEAIALLESVRQKDPQASGVEAKLAKAYYRKRVFRRAIAHFKRALEQNPDDPETAQLLGLSFYFSGEFQQAIPLLERIQPHIPSGDLDPWYLLGVCYLKTEQPDKARAAFAQMFSVPPDSPTAHLLFAQMMVRQHLEEKAVPELEKAISGDPRLPMAHFLLGEIYLYQVNPKRALDEFKKELEINP